MGDQLGDIIATRPVGDLAIDSLDSRYCFWQGAGGERYIFSQISIDEIADFNDCILLLAIEQGTFPDIHWIGDVSDLTPMVLNDLCPDQLMHLSAYVHLLAGSKTERGQIIADLEADMDQPGRKKSA